MMPTKIFHRPTLTIAAVALCVLVSQPVTAQESDKAVAYAQEGAGHFKGGRYLKAARAFEKAVRLDPSDRTYLRYAGRAWQEVGHVERARRLLQLYVTLETDEGLRTSIAPRVKVLEAATPKLIADQLLKATRKHPMGRLEGDTAAAFARLNDEKSLKLALTLYETARLTAPTDKKREDVGDKMSKIRARLDALKATGKALVEPKPKPADKTPDPVKPKPAQSDTLGTVLYIAGSLLLVGGGGLAAFGYMTADGANEEWSKDKDLKVAERHFKSHSAYKDEKASGDSMNLIGSAVAGVGGAVLLWAIIRSATGGSEKQAWYVAPALARDGTGLALGGSF